MQRFRKVNTRPIRVVVLVAVALVVVVVLSMLDYRRRDAHPPTDRSGIHKVVDSSRRALEVLHVLPVPAAKKLPTSSSTTTTSYPLHSGVSTTIFWIGESAGPENGNIANVASAWDEVWLDHYGGTDDPSHRNGYAPAAFTPRQNPFYVALPYNDFDAHGNKKASAVQYCPAGCKNRWIAINYRGKTAYAQWEDVGPYEEDDAGYVFGAAAPKNKSNQHAGLDVSPAVRDYLGLSGISATAWSFVDSAAVGPGPWKTTVTTSPVFWQ